MIDTELQRCLSAQIRQLFCAKVRTLDGKTWDPELSGLVDMASLLLEVTAETFHLQGTRYLLRSFSHLLSWLLERELGVTLHVTWWRHAGLHKGGEKLHLGRAITLS